MNALQSASFTAAQSLNRSLSLPEADYQIIRPDTRRRVTSTNNITDAPYRYICQIIMRTSGRTFVGTGTLVGPRTVLTVAHNIFSPVTRRQVTPSQLQITPARDNANAPFGTTRAQRLIPNPDYVHVRHQNTQRDFAIIHLRDALGNRAGWWGQRPRPAFDTRGTTISDRLPLPAGTLKVNLSGYPVDKGGSEQWRAWNKTIRLRDGLLHYLNDTERGHSGSPVWVKRSRSVGGRTLVGIHVGRHPTQRTSNRAVDITPDILDFIRRNTR
jgi:V8-like Glu-specific endopeptidase